MDLAAFKKELALMSGDFLRIQGEFGAKVLQLQPGQRAVVVNGEVCFFSFSEFG